LSSRGKLPRVRTRPIPTRVVASVRPAKLRPAQAARELRERIEAGEALLPAGSARRAPGLLLRAYPPHARVALFDTFFYLGEPRQNTDLRFFVGYVAGACAPPAPSPAVFPRIFYKDVSLVWRVASHYARSEHENWIGKGDIQEVEVGGETLVSSYEASCDLPFELQTSFETLVRRSTRIGEDERAVPLVLRRGPDDRIAAYRDFTEPRARARADRRNLVHGGRPVAHFARPGDPESLRFAAGYEPDFAAKPLETAHSTSTLYGGRVRRFRIASRNRRIQYLFFAAPHQVWLAPPQATTTELSSFGVRTVDVNVDEDLCVPGYEYHQPDGDSQIPRGFAGAVSPRDASRYDASPWLERLPVIREFRQQILGKG
jgi:hypothetical protein